MKIEKCEVCGDRHAMAGSAFCYWCSAAHCQMPIEQREEIRAIRAQNDQGFACQDRTPYRFYGRTT